MTTTVRLWWWDQFGGDGYQIRSVDLGTFTASTSVSAEAYMYGDYPERWMGGEWSGDYGYMIGDGSGTTSYLLKINAADDTVDSVVSLTQGVSSDPSYPYVTKSSNGAYLYTVDTDYSGTERFVLHRVDLSDDSVDYLTLDGYSWNDYWNYLGIVYDDGNEKFYVDASGPSPTYSTYRLKIDLASMTLDSATNMDADTGSFFSTGRGFVYGGYAYFPGADNVDDLPQLQKQNLSTGARTVINVGSTDDYFASWAILDSDTDIAYVGTDTGTIIKFDPSDDSEVATLAGPTGSPGLRAAYWMRLIDGYLYVPYYWGSGVPWRLYRVDLSTFDWDGYVSDASWGRAPTWDVMVTYVTSGAVSTENPHLYLVM